MCSVDPRRFVDTFYTQNQREYAVKFSCAQEDTPPIDLNQKDCPEEHYPVNNLLVASINSLLG